MVGYNYTLTFFQSGDTSGADMAAAPMTVTSERQRVASFLEAFVHGGLTGVIRKPYLDDYMRSPLDSIYFNVMRPLSTGVWVSIILSCVVVSAYHINVGLYITTTNATVHIWTIALVFKYLSLGCI